MERLGQATCTALQISIGWLSVISSVIPLALEVILPIRIIPMGQNLIMHKLDLVKK